MDQSIGLVRAACRPVLIAGALCLALSGCGGGSAEPAPPVPPTPSQPTVAAPSAPTGLAVAYSIKGYRFSWAAAAGATHYELTEDSDGAGPLPEAQVGGALTSVSYVHSLAPQLLHQRINASYRLRACNAGGCSAFTAPLVPDLTQAVGYFKGNAPGWGGRYGWSIAFSSDGSTLAVGSPGDKIAGPNGGAGEAGGSIDVYTRSDGVWSFQAHIKASNASQLGYSLALSADGSVLIAGAPTESSGATGIDGNQADNSVAYAGAVYAFARSGNTWSQQAYIKASNTQEGAGFGVAVALSADGNTLAVGAPNEGSGATGIDGNQGDRSASWAGAVYVFAHSGSTWSQQTYIKASNAQKGDQFGFSLALSADGHTLAVGAATEDSSATGINGLQTDDAATDAGAVYVLTRSGMTWSQQAYIKASNARAGDQFGYSLALSADGSTLIAGAPMERSSAAGVNGNQSDNSAEYAGAVYAFTRSGSTWSQQAYIKASNTQSGDLFGRSLALSADGHTLVVGATDEDGGTRGINGDQISNSALSAGATYLYKRDGSTWSQRAYIKASNTVDQATYMYPGSNARFGYGLALTADGSTLAVGAPGEDGQAMGIGGNQADHSALGTGAVYLY